MRDQFQDDPGGAETIFAAWALRVEAGEALAFDDLVAEHPAHADELRGFHADWKLFAPLLGRAVPGLISGEAGIVLAPLSASAAEEGEPPSAELLDRLGLHAPNTGRYRFRSVIGRGGGGVVLKVWDTKLHRALAMKVVLGRGEDRPSGDTPRVDGRTLSRFVDEARIASQLSHPGIVPVHELGADETGRAFFTMKLVKGEDLARVFEHVKTGHDGWNQTRALNVLLRVCESVAFAHEKGVLHRDLKPANVMVGRHGEVYVMDWGLARVLGEEDKKDVRVRPPAASSALLSVRKSPQGETPDAPLYTMDGDVVGTPAYMPPEQAAGDLARMGPHSDVYAIGAMLYHLLAGHMPYVPPGMRTTNYAIWQRVQEGPPTSIQSLAPRAPAELNAICEKAMAREPQQRYRDVSELASDLRAFLEGRVVGAHEIGMLGRARKWVRRNRALSMSMTLGLVLILAAAMYISERAVRMAKEQQRERLRELADLWAAPFMMAGLWSAAEDIWPALPERADDLARWLEQADALARERPRYEAALATLPGEPVRYELGELDARMEAPLADLIDRLDELPERRAWMEARHELATTVEGLTVSGAEARERWAEAIASIAGLDVYGGLELEPQLGLLPLRQDPESGLWEFWHVLSGEEPELDPNTDRWRIEAATGVVLVLIPGGTYEIGVPQVAKDDPLFDTYAQPNYKDPPQVEVELAPFFLSKYELTQAQWERARGKNPSQNREAREPAVLPADTVSWDESSETLRRLDLTFPTEAQWEAAGRAGSPARFYTGPHPATLEGHANVEPLTDGSGAFLWEQTSHALPVGSLEPNAFGLHDIHGNVWEWCLDTWDSLDPVATPRAGDGLHSADAHTNQRILRGGGFAGGWEIVRITFRYFWERQNAEPDVGLRPARTVR